MKPLPKYYLAYQIKNEMVVACMGDRKGAYRDWWGNLKERAHPENIGDR
jgi:hypothetical protein